MTQDYSYDYEWDISYCYSNSNVLINKLNICDYELLIEAEREITSLRLAEIKNKYVKGKFNLSHLCSIHKAIFLDIYTWAGKLRTVNISKGNQFCLSDVLIEYSEEIFLKLKNEKYLIGTDQNNIFKKLSYYLSEINTLHPFREGNGRSQRIFIEYLANVAGYEVDFSDVTNEEMIVASADAFEMKYGKLNSLFERITNKISTDEQKDTIKYFFGINSPEMKYFLKLSQ